MVLRYFSEADSAFANILPNPKTYIHFQFLKPSFKNEVAAAI